VVNAAITLVGRELQSAAGFEGNDQAFEKWMMASSAGVEHEIEAEKARPNTSATPMVPSEEELKADIRREIDRLFADAFPLTTYKSAASV
jgi:hypothetical protein